LNITQKKKILEQAFNYTNKNKNYSSLDLSSIAYEYYKIKDSLNFLKVNKKALELAVTNKNNYAIGDIHWNYASYYTKLDFLDKAYKHFNEGYKAFSINNNKNEAGQMLYGMSRIKALFKDYANSEILNIKAIKLLKEVNNYKKLYSAYNNLALLQRDIKEYDRAIHYFELSLFFFNKIENTKRKYIGTFNNIGNVYLKKKDYINALKYYNLDLKQKISTEHYARVINNRAYCKLMMEDTIGIKKDFFKALKIRDSIGNRSGILTSKLNISDYFTYSNNTDKAIRYAKEANQLAQELKNGKDYLTSLQQLANLDTKNSKQYLDRYIEFNDSLITIERKTQNKFTRIEFETDEHIEKNEQLSQQLIWSIGGSVSILLIATLLYFLRVQKVKNEKLQLEAAQQKANEEVYVLTLQQQAKLEEERVKERNRISAELHDGILGKLFGTRVSLGFLGMQMKTETQEKQQGFLDELQAIEKEIREVSHKLSENFDDAKINFTTIIEQLLADKSVIGNFKTHFTTDDTIAWKTIDEVTKANIYRIIQEALQNIIKHAKAKNVTLVFSILNKKLGIEITDDGVGFDMKKSKKGIGIKNINSRIAKLGGDVSFSSKLHQGTTLLIKLPINQ